MDRAEAKARFREALQIAKSNEPLPEEWEQYTQDIAQAPNKTFTAVLATALLAKATDARIDAFALREGESHRSYSARSLAKEVLVPCCVEGGVNIRVTGAEPLNNRPFIDATRISTDLNVKKAARRSLGDLCKMLECADFLDEGSALRALAAFLRERSEPPEAQPRPDISVEFLSLRQAMLLIENFLLEDSEGGRTGQAIVAAMHDLVFSDVRTRRINDPSVTWPGDVGVFHRNLLTLGCEVKQRPFTSAEILLFAKRLSDAGIHRGLIAALRGYEAECNADALRQSAQQDYDVEMSFVASASELLESVVAHAPTDLPQSLMQLLERIAERLEELEVSDELRARWSQMARARPAG